MAGAGYRVWNALDVLAAADVNTYLMQQSVMVFDDAADRSSIIASPSAGMMSFRIDSTALEVYNGSSWVSVGSRAGTVVGSQITGEVTSGTINATNVTNTITASTATAYSVAGSDQGKLLRFTAAGTVTATVGTATALTTGQRVDILADGAAGVRIAAGSGVTIAGAGTAGTAYLLGQYEAATVLAVASNTYRIIGNIEAV